MYLVSDTVEQSIYDLSVSRRLAHIMQKEKKKEKQLTSTSDNGTSIPKLTETVIDSANSLEMQDAALSKLMAGGASGGEMVKKDDLWQCLFGNSSQNKPMNAHLADAGGEVARFLRGEAAEQRSEATAHA